MIDVFKAFGEHMMREEFWMACSAADGPNLKWLQLSHDQCYSVLCLVAGPFLANGAAQPGSWEPVYGNMSVGDQSMMMCLLGTSIWEHVCWGPVYGNISVGTSL